MLLLAIRTDKPEAEIGLYNDATPLTYHTWEAHRQLAETLHKTLTEVTEGQNKRLSEIEGIVVFKGPGSFTGLRIGITVANALAKSFAVPIVAQDGDDWLDTGIKRLLAGGDDIVALPEYGADVFITPQKK